MSIYDTDWQSGLMSFVIRGIRSRATGWSISASPIKIQCSSSLLVKWLTNASQIIYQCWLARIMAHLWWLDDSSMLANDSSVLATWLIHARQIAHKCCSDGYSVLPGGSSVPVRWHISAGQMTYQHWPHGLSDASVFN